MHYYIILSDNNQDRATQQILSVLHSFPANDYYVRRWSSLSPAEKFPKQPQVVGTPMVMDVVQKHIYYGTDALQFLMTHQPSPPPPPPPSSMGATEAPTTMA